MLKHVGPYRSTSSLGRTSSSSIRHSPTPTGDKEEKVKSLESTPEFSRKDLRSSGSFVGGSSGPPPEPYKKRSLTSPGSMLLFKPSCPEEGPCGLSSLPPSGICREKSPEGEGSSCRSSTLPRRDLQQRLRESSLAGKDRFFASSLSFTSLPASTRQRSSSTSSLCSHMTVPVKIYVRSLRPDFEYTTLSLSTATTCRELIRMLLTKFRLRHRDPNLFFVTMEVEVRAPGGGPPVRKTLVLEADARPAELQQCRPRGGARFALAMRRGGLVRVHDSILMPGSQYKSLLISYQTTAEDLIALLLNCYSIRESTHHYALHELCRKPYHDRPLKSADCPLQVLGDWPKDARANYAFILRRNISYTLSLKSKISWRRSLDQSSTDTESELEEHNTTASSVTSSTSLSSSSGGSPSSRSSVSSTSSIGSSFSGDSSDSGFSGTILESPFQQSGVAVPAKQGGTPDVGGAPPTRTSFLLFKSSASSIDLTKIEQAPSEDSGLASEADLPLLLDSESRSPLLDSPGGSSASFSSCLASFSSRLSARLVSTPSVSLPRLEKARRTKLSPSSPSLSLFAASFQEFSTSLSNSPLGKLGLHRTSHHFDSAEAEVSLLHSSRNKPVPASRASDSPPESPASRPVPPTPPLRPLQTLSEAKSAPSPSSSLVIPSPESPTSITSTAGGSLSVSFTVTSTRPAPPLVTSESPPTTHLNLAGADGGPHPTTVITIPSSGPSTISSVVSSSVTCQASSAGGAESCSSAAEKQLKDAIASLRTLTIKCHGKRTTFFI